MRVQGVIFDLDGTLTDTLPVCTEAFRRAAEPLLGKALTDEEIHASFGPSEEGSVHRLVPGQGEECLSAYLSHYADLHQSVDAPFPGVVELLTELRAGGVRLGLVTGKGPRTCEITLARIGLGAHFSHIECGCAEGPCKPAKIRLILNDWQIAPDHVAYVGDSPSDVDSARETGLVALGAAWGTMTSAEAIRAKGPDQLFESVRALHQWLFSETS